jgi:hypothetical protein
MAKRSDSSVSVVASNCHTVTPARKLDRFGTAYSKKTKIQVDCPPAIQNYSKYMRRVDRFDENADHFEWVWEVRSGGVQFLHLALILPAKMRRI